MKDESYRKKARYPALLLGLLGLASAQGCSDSDSDGGSGSGGGGAGGSPSAAGSPSVAGAHSEAGRSGLAGGGSDGGQAEGGAAGSGGTGAVGASGGGGAGDSAGGGGGGDGDGGGGDGGSGSACDDESAAPSCDGVAAACTPFCTAALANLKKAVALDAIVCLKQDASAGCATGYDCLATATALGCSEDVATACDVASQNCQLTSHGKPPCAQLLSGLNDEARGEMLLCLEQYCESVWVCAQSQFFESPT